MLGELAVRSNDATTAIRYLEQAGQTGEKVGFSRLVGQAMFDLSNVYLQRGDLTKAEQRLQAGLDASRRIGDRYFLPQQLEALANLQAKMGRFAEAHAVYQNAEDIVDGMLIHAPGAYTASSLISVMSYLYLGDFELEARQNDIATAFSIIERARGRTAVDMLQSRSEGVQAAASEASQLDNQISLLQAKLMRSSNAVDRTTLLDSLDDAENELIYVSDSVAPSHALRVTLCEPFLGDFSI